MDLSRTELIIHPVRLRILHTLLGETLTTQEIAERLPDVPTSSLYRHLRLLRRGGVVEVEEKRLVHGIQEKVYALAQSPRLGPEEVRALDADTHFRLFTTFVLTLLHEYANYLAMAAAKNGSIDMAADFTGYTEAMFYASDAELVVFQEALNAALVPLLKNGRRSDRRRFKLAVIGHPVPGGRQEKMDEKDDD
jgi:DNA-binding transcriptional ArsR family regulator